MNYSTRNFLKLGSIFVPGLFFIRSVRAASTIINYTISAASQNVISMANSTWARPVTIPASWSKVRVGIRCRFLNTGAASLTGNPILTFGLCSGTNNQYGDATTTHFIGLAFDFATWTWTSSLGGSGQGGFNNGVNTGIARKRVGTTNTNSTVLATTVSAAIWAPTSGTVALRQPIFIDITKGSPNYTFHLPFYTDINVSNPTDVSAATFLNIMGQITPGAFQSGYLTGAQSDQTLAVNEGTDGTLNAVCAYWNRADATFEICDLAVAVLA